MTLESSSQEHFDVIIVGGGPAGISCMNYC